jgi:hypothetical protein
VRRRFDTQDVVSTPECAAPFVNHITGFQQLPRI